MDDIVGESFDLNRSIDVNDTLLSKEFNLLENSFFAQHSLVVD